MPSSSAEYRKEIERWSLYGFDILYNRSQRLSSSKSLRTFLSVCQGHFIARSRDFEWYRCDLTNDQLHIIARSALLKARSLGYTSLLREFDYLGSDHAFEQAAMRSIQFEEEASTPPTEAERNMVFEGLRGAMEAMAQVFSVELPEFGNMFDAFLIPNSEKIARSMEPEQPPPPETNAEVEIRTIRFVKKR